MSRSELLCGYTASVLRRALDNIEWEIEKLRGEGLAKITSERLDEYRKILDYFLSEVDALVNNLHFSCKGIDKEELERLTSWLKVSKEDLKKAFEKKDEKILNMARVEIASMKHHIPTALRRTES